MESALLVLLGASIYVVAMGTPAVLVTAQLLLAWPILRGMRPVDPGRRTAAGVLALVCLLGCAPFLSDAVAGKPFPLAIAVVLVGPSVLTLLTLYRASRTPLEGPDRGH